MIIIPITRDVYYQGCAELRVMGFTSTPVDTTDIDCDTWGSRLFSHPDYSMWVRLFRPYGSGPRGPIGSRVVIHLAEANMKETQCWDEARRSVVWGMECEDRLSDAKEHSSAVSRFIAGVP